MSDPSDFWAEENEVLLHKRTRTLHHVYQRYWDVDHSDAKHPNRGRYYRLWDDTHTADDYWPEEDLRDCFVRIGVKVTGKPRQADALEYWYD